MEAYLQLLIYLAGPAILALIAWIWALWNSHTNFKLHVTEHYVKKDTLDSLNRDMKEMKLLLYEIAAKVGVPINRPF